MCDFRLAVRALALLAHAIWFGGFTFYGAVVIGVVHDSFGSLEGGLITQQVTYSLNWIGVGTLVIWWLMAWLERDRRPKYARFALVGLIGLSTALLIFLFVDHRILDRRLEEHGLSGFYAYHSIYLNASTVQWVANLLLIPVLLWRNENDHVSGVARL